MECVYCRSEENTNDNPLLLPCKCTTGVVHRECVATWVNTTGNKKCGACRTEFSFVQKNTGYLNDWIITLVEIIRMVSNIMSYILPVFMISVLIYTPVALFFSWFISKPITIFKLALCYFGKLCVYLFLGMLFARYGTEALLFNKETLYRYLAVIFAISESILIVLYYIDNKNSFMLIMLVSINVVKLLKLITYDYFLVEYNTKYYKRVYTNRKELRSFQT